ncbi:hypothetical protein [Heyndrickxia acidiproducens]|uniref:aldose epimerase family protein n=1 Tax=Heyndrickxia acidiproducens TaxID=1121084 RepID=UPI00036E1F8E|nr:hypothetical protein [Heyndrickxia acidiproducens]
MYKIEKYKDHTLEMYKLSCPTTHTYLTICPERGGMITAFHTDGEDVFYMDPETLYDPSKNIRGGNPVLFPMAGQLTNGTYSLGEKTYKMPNHGLARQARWDVTRTEANEERASVTLQFVSSEDTLKFYPFQFKAQFTYTLENGKAFIRQQYENLSSEQMPVYPGFHPYFHIKRKKITLNSYAGKYIDYNDDSIHPFNGSIDMSGKKEAVVLVGSSEKKMTASFSGRHNLVIEKDPIFSYTVLWVQEGKDFFCIEPWTAKKDAFNRKGELILIEPHETFKTQLAFGLVRAN